MFVSFGDLIFDSGFTEYLASKGFTTATARKLLIREAAAAGTWARYAPGIDHRNSGAIQIDLVACRAALDTP